MNNLNNITNNHCILLCGLGNPGKDYSITRHNLGFLLVDYLVKNICNTTFVKKFSGEIVKYLMDNINVIFFKPMTFMNLSGKAVLQVATFYNIDKSNIIIIHDDIDLNFTDVRIKKGGGNGGHNGLKSIDQSIGKEYWRIRFGVGKDDNMQTADFVLSKFPKAELEKLETVFNFFKENISFLLSNIEENRAKFIENYKKNL